MTYSKARTLMAALMTLTATVSAQAEHGEEIIRCMGASKHASVAFEVSILEYRDSLGIGPSDRNDPRSGLRLWVPYHFFYVEEDSAARLTIDRTERAYGLKTYQQLLKIDFNTGKGIARYYDRRLPSGDRLKEIRLSGCSRR